MGDFDTVFRGFADCRKCRDIVPEIAELPANEFQFHWKPYLRGSCPLRFVFLGWEPSLFLESHPETYGAIIGNRRIHRITHYSPRCNPHFHRFAKESNREFDRFSERFRPKYETFIKTGEFRGHWEWYNRSASNSK